MYNLTLCSIYGILISLSCVLFTNADASTNRRLAPLPIISVVQAPRLAWGLGNGLSPQGNMIAYGLCRSPQVYATCELIVQEITSKRVLYRANGKSASGMPTWSPDGNYLVYWRGPEDRMQLVMWNRKTGIARPVGVTPKSQVQWLPDSSAFIVGVPSPPKSYSWHSEIPGSSAMVYRSMANLTYEEKRAFLGSQSDAPAYPIANMQQDLVLVNAHTMRRIKLATGMNLPWAVLPHDPIAPDGSFVALATTIRMDSSQLYHYDIVALSVVTGSRKVIAHDVTGGLEFPIFWSNDSRYLYWVSNDWISKGTDENHNLFSYYDFSTGKLHVFTSRIKLNFVYEKPYERGKHLYFLNRNYLVGNTGVFSVQLAVANGSNGWIAKLPSLHNYTLQDIIGPEPDNPDKLLVFAHRNGSPMESFFDFDVITKKFRQLYEESANIDQITQNGNKIGYVRERIDASQDVWVSDTGFRRRKRVTNFVSQFDNYMLGASKVIAYRVADGTILHASLLLPAGYQLGHRYPTIVYPYPGALRSNDVNNVGLGEEPFNIENLQVLATRGYAVLAPDVVIAHCSDEPRNILDDVNSAVDAVVKMGVTDPNRLGIMGHSDGGYAVLTVITRTSRFKAAISRSGFSDFFSVFGEMLPDGSSYGISQAITPCLGPGGSPWQYRSRYLADSPFFSLDRISTPLLITSGTNDTAVPPFLSDQTFVALRYLKKDVVLAKYHGEHFEPEWSAADQLDYLTRMVHWWDRYLCPNRKSPTQCN